MDFKTEFSRLAKRIENKTSISINTSKIDFEKRLGHDSTGFEGMFAAPSPIAVLTRLEANVETIFVKTDKGFDRAIATLLHELAHATGTCIRLNRLGIGHEKLLYSMDFRVKAIEETIAETVSLELMSHFGLATFTTRAYSLQYLAFYPTRDFVSPEMIRHLVDASKRYILDHWLTNYETAASVLQYENESMDRVKEFHKFF